MFPYQKDYMYSFSMRFKVVKRMAILKGLRSLNFFCNIKVVLVDLTMNDLTLQTTREEEPNSHPRE